MTAHLRRAGDGRFNPHVGPFERDEMVEDWR